MGRHHDSFLLIFTEASVQPHFCLTMGSVCPQLHVWFAIIKAAGKWFRPLPDSLVCLERSEILRTYEGNGQSPLEDPGVTQA